MYRSVAGTLLVLAVASMPACDGDGVLVGPDRVESDSVEVTVAIEPGIVAAGDSVEIRVELRNRTDDRVVLGFAMGCPFYLEVVEWGTGQTVAMEGSGYPCLAVVSSIEVPAHTTLTLAKPLVARVDGAPAKPGAYVARLDFTNGIWDLEALFEVE